MSPFPCQGTPSFPIAHLCTHTEQLHLLGTHCQAPVDCRHSQARHQTCVYLGASPRVPYLELCRQLTLSKGLFVCFGSWGSSQLSVMISRNKEGPGVGEWQKRPLHCGALSSFFPAAAQRDSGDFDPFLPECDLGTPGSVLRCPSAGTSQLMNITPPSLAGFSLSSSPASSTLRASPSVRICPLCLPSPGQGLSVPRR